MPRRAHCQEHPCLAAPAVIAYGRPIDRLDLIPDEELRARSPGLHRALAHRPVGAQLREPGDQAAIRQSRSRGERL
jgi:hypothetical protein